MEGVLLEAAERLKDNFPYFHPLYAGQMLKPPHPMARMAYALAMWINPNNHALDGGRATSAMEKEAAARMKALAGYQVNAALLAKADPKAVVLHCLPAHRDEEISADVIDGPQSAIFDEAENRLHVQKALLEHLILRRDG